MCILGFFVNTRYEIGGFAIIIVNKWLLRMQLTEN